MQTAHAMETISLAGCSTEPFFWKPHLATLTMKGIVTLTWTCLLLIVWPEKCRWVPCCPWHWNPNASMLRVRCSAGTLRRQTNWNFMIWISSTCYRNRHQTAPFVTLRWDTFAKKVCINAMRFTPKQTPFFQIKLIRIWAWRRDDKTRSFFRR